MIALYVFGYLLTGFIGVSICSFIDLKDGIDYTSETLCFSILFSFAGPATLILAMLYLIQNKFKNKVLIKAKNENN